MVQHTVALGETIRSIAYSYGIPDWRSVYQHFRNADLRRRRPDPDILHPGDHVWLEQPEEPATPYPGAPVTCRTGATYTFLAPPLVPIEVRMIDRLGEPHADRRFELVAGGNTTAGTTDSEGAVRASVPLDVRSAQLRVWIHDDDPDDEPGWQVTLDLNATRAADTLEGVQSRLANLGYYLGPIDGEERQSLRDAVEQFQRDQGLSVTGEVDDKLKRALADAHPA